MTRHRLAHGEIIRARVEAVYPTIADGSVTLVHSDGPYGLRKAEWDKVPNLAAFYRPHIAEWSRICAPSASVCLWNTAEGWAAVHPEMVAAGWEFGTLIVWHKTGANPALLGAATSARRWPSLIEVCGFYQRGHAPFTPPGMGNVWTIGAVDISDERLLSGAITVRTFGAKLCNEPLHPCQKPLLFAERILRASSRPGDLVFEPFGGTCRIAVANERIARFAPEEARRTLTVEQDEDGREYIAAVLASLGGDLGAPASAAGQMRMFE
jgi:hypothetical protein